jgi:hypothetical protein
MNAASSVPADPGSLATGRCVAQGSLGRSGRTRAWPPRTRNPFPDMPPAWTQCSRAAKEKPPELALKPGEIDRERAPLSNYQSGALPSATQKRPTPGWRGRFCVVLLSASPWADEGGCSGTGARCTSPRKQPRLGDGSLVPFVLVLAGSASTERQRPFEGDRGATALSGGRVPAPGLSRHGGRFVPWEVRLGAPRSRGAAAGVPGPKSRLRPGSLRQ